MNARSQNGLVSVIITNYNYGRYLGAAVEAALSQTYSDVEVIVVDDGSTDDSLAVLEQFRDSIHLIQHQRRGQPAALNAAVAIARGEFIMPCDADDLFSIVKVSKVVNTFREFPGAGWIFHSLSYIDGSGAALPVEALGNPADVAAAKARFAQYPDTHYLDFRDKFAKGQRLDYACPAMSGLCFRADLLRQILPMAEDIAVASDEYPKLAALALSAGVHIGFPLAYQRLHGQNAATLSVKNKMGDASRYIRTAYHLRKRFPVTARTTDKWFGQSVGILIGQRGGLRSAWKMHEVKDYPVKLWDRSFLVVLPRVIAHCLRESLLAKST